MKILISSFQKRRSKNFDKIKKSIFASNSNGIYETKKGMQQP